MAKVHLHIVDAAGPVAYAVGLAGVAARLARDREAGLDARLVLVGGASLAREARAVGVADAATPVVGAVDGHSWRNLPGLAHALRAMGPIRLERIHCWSPGALWAGQVLRPRVAKTLTLLRGPGRAAVHAMRWSSALSRSQVMAETPFEPVAGRLLSRGVDPRQVLVTEPIEPAAQPAVAQRAELRRRWGVEPDPADESFGSEPGEPRRWKVVAMLSEPPHAGDAATGMMAVGLARESLRGDAAGSSHAVAELTLLIHPRQQHGPRAKHNMAQVARHHLLTQEPALDRPWTVLPGCDAALVLGEAPNAIAFARRAGVPIVAEAHPLNADALSDGPETRLVTPGAGKYAAHALEAIFASQGDPAAPLPA